MPKRRLLLKIPRTSDDPRWLMIHDGSDSIFEVFSARQLKGHLENGCDDVTNIEHFENIYKLRQRKGTKVADPTARKRAVITEKQEVVVDLPLHLKYRPTKLSEVIGQDEAINSIKKALESKTPPHTFLFVGPSGCGKTTLARIVAKMTGCSPENITEADAATNTGIDASRELTSGLRYKGFGDTPNKMIILDEAHMLSKNAFASLLKSIEEPPAHVYFALCTTDEGKIPEAVRTRCHTYKVKPVKFDPLMDLLEYVVEEEQLNPIVGLLEQVARACDGSPRKALVMLSMVAECETADEAAVLLEAPLDNKEIIDLARLLISGDLNWTKVVTTLKAMPEQSSEGIRIVIVNYLNACLMGAKNDKQVGPLLDILSEFTKPCNPSDKLAPILLAFGNIIYPK